MIGDIAFGELSGLERSSFMPWLPPSFPEHWAVFLDWMPVSFFFFSGDPRGLPVSLSMPVRSWLRICRQGIPREARPRRPIASPEPRNLWIFSSGGPSPRVIGDRQLGDWLRAMMSDGESDLALSLKTRDPRRDDDWRRVTVPEETESVSLYTRAVNDLMRLAGRSGVCASVRRMLSLLSRRWENSEAFFGALGLSGDNACLFSGTVLSSPCMSQVWLDSSLGVSPTAQQADCQDFAPKKA